MRLIPQTPEDVCWALPDSPVPVIAQVADLLVRSPFSGLLTPVAGVRAYEFAYISRTSDLYWHAAATPGWIAEARLGDGTVRARRLVRGLGSPARQTTWSYKPMRGRTNGPDVGRGYGLRFRRRL